MKFTKNKLMSLIAAFVVIAVYSAAAFVLPFVRGNVFWVAYGFSVLALLVNVGVGLFALGKEGMKSKFYGLPLVTLVWTYLVIQMIVGVIEMCMPGVAFKYFILVNGALLGLCLIGLIAVDLAKEEVERLDEKVREKVFFIKSLQADMEGLADRAQDGGAKASLKELAETIRYSDPMSSPQLSAIENKIEIKAAELARSIDDAEAVGALCGELQMLFAERNRKCKLLK